MCYDICKGTNNLKPVVMAAGNLLDCSTYCSIPTAIPRLLGDTGLAGVKLYMEGKAPAGIQLAKTAALAGCTASSLLPGGGIYLCQICCNGVKALPID